MKIGIIGAGFIGRALAKVAIASGHEVMISNSRNPITLASTAVALGSQTGTAEEASRFGDVVIASVPFSAYQSLDSEALAGKVVLDTLNHYPHRDGAYADLEANAISTGELLQRHLPAAKVVKAFNAILQGDIEADARSKGQSNRRALPIAGDDKQARQIAAALVSEFGFDVVDAGKMSESWRFERGMPAYCVPLNHAELVTALAAAKKGQRVVEGSWRTTKKSASAKQQAEDKLIGVAGRGELDIVDAQIHLMLEPTVKETCSALDALGIRSVIVDEFWRFDAVGNSVPHAPLMNGQTRPLTAHALTASLESPDRFAFVQRVNRQDPGLERLVPTLRETPGCVGIRIVLSSGKERKQFLDGGWDPVLRLASAAQFPVNILTADMPSVIEIARNRFTDLDLIVDHCGWCGSVTEWDEILKLERFPRTYLKWSHANRTFRHFDNPRESQSLGLVQAVKAFGADRVMWASDVTHEETSQSWSELLEFTRGHTSLSDTDRRWVLGATVRQVYNWNVK